MTASLQVCLSIIEAEPGKVQLVDILATVALVASVIPAFLFAINVWLFRRPGREWNKRHLPPVSVLIPARNEEASIAAAVASVLASRGVELEVIVLDDDSTDHTAAIVQSIADEDSRVCIQKAPPLLDGWNGKQHACWVLASLAAHEVLCFLDADVRLEEQALYRMSSELNFVDESGSQLAMVSGFPRQETRTFLEWLLLPLIHFVLLCFLPLSGERASLRAGFAAGCGQFMMVRRESYLATGGHCAIRASMHDGLLLPQLFRRHGFTTSVYDLSQDAVCRMYRNAREVWRGLAKNATEGMASPSRLPVFTLILIAGQVLPLLIWLWAVIVQDEIAMNLSFLALFAGFAVRVVSAIRYQQDWRGVLLHPLGVLLLVALQWHAMLRKLQRKPTTWKERAYQVE